MANKRQYFIIYILLLSAGIGICQVEAYNQAEIYALIKYLFNTGYRPQVRPTDNGDPTYVYVEVSLLSVQDLDERNQELETSLILEAYWDDSYLSWNVSEFSGIEDIMFPQEYIWIPDIVIENSVVRQKQMGYDENKIRILSSGLVSWRPSIITRTSCDINVKYYPFDTQTCSIIVSTWMSTKTDIDIDPDRSSSGFRVDKYSESGTWKLVNNTLELLPDADDRTRIQFTIKLERRHSWYILNIIVPIIFLSVTASMVFLLPADAGEKIGMCITILLAYTVYLTIIAESMPVTSLQVSLLAVYLTIMLGINALGVILATIVLHIHHKPEEVTIGPKTVRFIRGLRCLVCVSSPKQWVEVEPERHFNMPPIPHRMSHSHKQHPGSRSYEDSNGYHRPEPTYQEVPEEITWNKVAATLDRVIFFIFGLAIAVVTVVFMVILVNGE